MSNKSFVTSLQHMNPRGFSLIEVLIVTLIGGIMAASFSALTVYQLKSASYVEDMISRDKLTNSIQLILSDSVACQETFSGVSVPGIDQSRSNIRIQDKNGADVYRATSGGNRQYFEQLEIQQIRMKNIDIGPGESSGRIEISLDLKRNRSGGGPTGLSVNNLEYRVQIDSTSRMIESCLGLVDENLEGFRTGRQDLPANNFSEQVLLTFTVDRLAKPAKITSTVNMGGVDKVWARFNLQKRRPDNTWAVVQQWADGTDHPLGAAIQTSETAVESSVEAGATTYRLTMTRISDPSYGTGPYHVNEAQVVFEQR